MRTATAFVVVALALTLAVRAGPVEEMMEQASQNVAKVQAHYIELTQEIWMERNDLDHMPPPRDIGEGNLGKGPRAHVTAAFQGQTLDRQKFLRDSWVAAAADLNKKINATMALLRGEQARLKGKEPDVATVDDDDKMVLTYSDPSLQRAVKNIREFSGRIDDQLRQLTEYLDWIAVGNAMIQRQLKPKPASTVTGQEARLEVSIDAAEETCVGRPFKIVARAQGGAGTLAYEWLTSSGKKVSGPVLSGKFSNPGQRVQTLRVYDQGRYQQSPYERTIAVQVYDELKGSSPGPMEIDSGDAVNLEPGVQGGKPELEYVWSLSDGRQYRGKTVHGKVHGNAGEKKMLTLVVRDRLNPPQEITLHYELRIRKKAESAPSSGRYQRGARLGGTRVDARNPNPTDVGVLLAQGKAYIVVGSGECSLWDGQNHGVDSVFRYDSPLAGKERVVWGQLELFNPNAHLSDLLEKQLGRKPEYHGNHIYEAVVVGTGQALRARVFDGGSYGDNHGALTVEVYEAIPLP